LFSSEENFHLGELQFVKVEDKIWVGNMIGQRDIKTNSTVTLHIRYEAVRSCLSKGIDFALKNNSSVHMLGIGCGLAGGK
jgi:hypothetical protein